MKRIAVDTDIFSFVFKGDSRAQPFESELDSAEVCLSFMTVAELYRWAVIRNWGGARIRVLKQRISECSILDYDDETAWQWARITTVPGKPVAFGDSWIAACAIRHGVPLLTHNRKHYKNIAGLVLVP